MKLKIPGHIETVARNKKYGEFDEIEKFLNFAGLRFTGPVVSRFGTSQ